MTAPNVKAQIPSTKLQTNLNDQISNPIRRGGAVLVVVIWGFDIVWNLVLEISDFPQRVRTLTRHTNNPEAAIGFRVKSGWASAVLVSGSSKSAQTIDQRAIDLCDPAIAESRQPYHAGMGRLETSEAVIERRKKVIVQAADRSIVELIKEYRNAGHTLRGAGLVVGSDIDPAKVASPHIRAHALEGRLFRTVLEDALRTCGLPSLVIVEKTAYARAAKVLKRSEAEVKRYVAEMGRSLVGPWRADEKTAALAAWLALASAASNRT
jgi:hypothetical protein